MEVPCRCPNSCCPVPPEACCPPPCCQLSFGLGAGYFKTCCCTACDNKFIQVDLEQKKPPEDDRLREQRLKPYFDSLETDRKVKLRMKYENRAEIRGIQSMAKFRTITDLEERRQDLERRSERLKRIIEDERFNYTQEIVNEFETQRDSKIEVMRERVKALRKKREEEDRKIVNDKLTQAFILNCDQMRTLKVQRQAKEIADDWAEQIRMKERLECEEEENDRMYAYLWMKDVENKIKREEMSAMTRKESLQKGLQELNRQMAYKKLEQQLQEEIRQREVEEVTRMRAIITEETKNQRFRL